MGASCQQIEKAYGPPDEKVRQPGGSSYLHYKSLGMSFSLRDDRLCTLRVSRE